LSFSASRPSSLPTATAACWRLLDQQQKGAALGRPFVLNRWSILRSFGWFPASICIFEAQDAIQFIFDIGNPLKRYANLLMLAAEEI